MFNRIKKLFEKKTTATSSNNIVTTTQYNLLNSQPNRYNHHIAMSMYKSWVAVCTNINASRLSTLPLRLYMKKPTGKNKKGEDLQSHWNFRIPTLQTKKYLSGSFNNKPATSLLYKTASFKDDYVEVIDSHPVLQLLSQVNTGMNQNDLVKLNVVNLQILGNSYWHIILNNLGIPSFIQPIPSEYMSVICSGKGYEKQITGYKYGQGNNSITFSYNEIIHFKRHNNYIDPLYGQSDLEQGWESIHINQDQKNYKMAQLKNMGRLDSMIRIPGRSNIDLQRYKKDYENKYMGPNNAGKAFFTNDKEIEIIPLSYSTIDLTAYDEQNLREIAAIFGLEENQVLGNSPIKANSENQDYRWLSGTITSLANSIEEKMNEQLLPLFDQETADNCFLAYDSAVQEDKEYLIKKNVAYVSRGIITANEARISEGLPPIEGGDELKVQNTPDPKIEEPIKKVKETETKNVNPFTININNNTEEYEVEEEIIKEEEEIIKE